MKFDSNIPLEEKNETEGFDKCFDHTPDVAD